MLSWTLRFYLVLLFKVTAAGHSLPGGLFRRNRVFGAPVWNWKGKRRTLKSLVLLADSIRKIRIAVMLGRISDSIHNSTQPSAVWRRFESMFKHDRSCIEGYMVRLTSSDFRMVGDKYE
jgi:hypothetical protein